MKNIFLPFFAILIVSAVFTSCSKENLTLNKPGETTSAAKMNPPEFTYGGIAGTLNPAPSYAIIKIYNDELNYVVYRCYADQTGHFKIGSIIPGNYHIIIAYVLNYQGTPPEPMPYLYFEIRGIIVNINTVTDLGDIQLITK
jgi:hypothetical protein